MSGLIEQSVFFQASPQDVYEALMDSGKHSAFTGSPAQISREVGGEFTAYGGYINGVNVELQPGAKIVQKWRAMDWPEEYFSLATFALASQDGGTRLDFTQTGLPDGTEEEFSQGWVDNYWEPLKDYLKA